MARSRAKHRLLDAVLGLRPFMEGWRDEGESQLTLPKPVYEAFLDMGLFHVWLSKELGGTELPLHETIAVIEEISRTDGSFGWSLAIGLELSLVTSRLPFQIAAEIYSARPLPVICGSILPPGRAERTDGGHFVSGEWALASGCRHSSWFAGNCIVLDIDGNQVMTEDGLPVTRFFFMPIESCEILDTWDSTGLRGTGSNHVRAHRIFVPERWDCALTDKSDHPGAMFRQTLFTLTRATVAAVALGIARQAIETFCELAHSKTPRGETSTLAKSQRVHEHLGLAQASLLASRAFLYETTAAITDTILSGGEVSREQNIVKDLASAHAVQCASNAVIAMFELSGSSGIYRNSRLDRCYRDMATLKQHFAVGYTRYIAAGELLLEDAR